MWLDEEGYLLDPEGAHSRYVQTDTVPFEAITSKPCLLLLGEPGSGKTDVMEKQCREAQAALLTGEELLAIDCRIHRDLRDDLFDDPKFRGWIEGKHTLHLFIDSLDEHPDVDAAARIVGRLKRGPIEQLRLRIACRTAEVPPILEPELQKHWGVDGEKKSRVAVYEIAPLRKKDVELAARSAGLDTTRFLSEIASRGAAALAIRPVTLDFLLRTFLSQRTLPKTRWEIYEIGCRILCEDGSVSRRTHRQKGRLDWSRRMAIAARIAAICILGNRSMIYLDSNPGDLPTEALLSEVLHGKKERLVEDLFEVDAESVQETLTVTGLFTERGQSRLLGWAHQTYAEFLTAYFLRKRGLRLEDLSNILYPSAECVQIVPALREVAAWMASMDSEMFRKLLQDDPRTLLQSDVAMVDDVEREKLVGALLERFANRDLIDLDVGGERVYRKLEHPGLKEQLEPWIRGKEKDLIARRAAIDIATACRVQALQDALADVALDASNHVYTRVSAADAIVKIGDDRTQQRLRPLAHGQVGEDPDYDLKAYALIALWPKHMSAKELFRCLTEPTRIGYIGAYHSFVSKLTESELSNADLVEALAWMAGRKVDLIDRFVDLADHLIWKAWERMDDPALLGGLVHLADVRFRRGEDLFVNRRVRAEESAPTEDEAAKCKQFIASFLESTKPLEHEYFVFERQGLLSPSDIQWMLQRLDTSTSPSARQRWANLIDVALRLGGFVFESINAVLGAWPRQRELQDALRWLEPVELGSAREAEQRKDWLKYVEQAAEFSRRRAERQMRLLDPPPSERVLRCLERFEQGDLDAFWKMQVEMSLRPASTHYEDHGQPDLRTFPGWQSAEEGTRSRILSAAKRYLLEREARPEQWLGQGVIYWPSVAGYRGLLLLFLMEPTWVEMLPASVWQRWAPAIIGFEEAMHGEPTRETHRRLVGLSYRHAPEETLWALAAIIKEEHRKGDETFVTRALSHCWKDKRLGSLLLLMVQNQSLKPSFFGSLLCELLEHRVAGAREYAASLLAVPIPGKGKARARARLAAEALFWQSEDAGWPVLEPVFRADPPFGHKVVLSAAARIDRLKEPRWRDLSEEQLADLFLWMEEQFPREDDGDQLRGRRSEVTPRDTVADVRDALLTTLSQRGTRASLEAIQRIEQVHPGKDWITFVRIRAQEHTLAGARRLLSPEEVIALQPCATIGPGNHGTKTMNEQTTNTDRLVERCDVLLMTATEIETRAVLAAAMAATERNARLIHGARTYHDLGEIGGAHVLLVSTVQAGSDVPGGSMMTASKAISEVGPKAIVMVGIAFGVDSTKQPIGQVLFSRQLASYGPARIGTDKDTGAQLTIPRGDTVTATPWLLDRFNTAKLSWKDGGTEGCEACLMLSGPSLVDNIDYRDVLMKLFPEAKGGEMEGAGLYGAATEEHVPWIVVKAICDWADGNKHEDKAERQDLAAKRAASFVLHALCLGGFLGGFAPRGHQGRRAID